ncbi:MAG TPA: hypothetical protein VFS81_14605 [Candidatus Binatia bacterium]|nr:hypothetical protein [Candidatus Binatia bacterium]
MNLTPGVWGDLAAGATTIEAIFSTNNSSYFDLDPIFNRFTSNDGNNSLMIVTTPVQRITIAEGERLWRSLN